jgi:hypothetical protein
MNQALVSGITGAAPIFNDIMSYVLKGREPVWQSKPSDVTSGQVCATGMPPGTKSDTPTKSTGKNTDGTQTGDQNLNCQVRGNTELFWMRSKPSDAGVTKKSTWIKSATGVPPQSGEGEDGLVLEEHTFYKDPVTKEFCADCNRKVDDQGKIQYERSVINQSESNSVESSGQ